MLRLVPSMLLPRRHLATLAALLLAAQLSLFAHAVGHDYFQDADQSHVMCGLCIAAQHLDQGLAAHSIELPAAASFLFATSTTTPAAHSNVRAAFQARAPPSELPL
ncbi:MAG: hypothetical protein IT492_04450 [Gammaproteobacteria bacterium]|nr:hypothetical protein [Gammaproteobacteria bacterium]